jgi:hypothetical protein
MLAWCRSLCKDNSKKNFKKKDKKDKHGKPEEGKSKHKMKNVYMYTITGQGKKNVEQDSWAMWELQEDNALVKFYGVFDGHGDFGKEVRA